MLWLTLSSLESKLSTIFTFSFFVILTDIKVFFSRVKVTEDRKNVLSSFTFSTILVSSSRQFREPFWAETATCLVFLWSIFFVRWTFVAAARTTDRGWSRSSRNRTRSEILTRARSVERFWRAQNCDVTQVGNSKLQNFFGNYSCNETKLSVTIFLPLWDLLKPLVTLYYLRQALADAQPPVEWPRLNTLHSPFGGIGVWANARSSRLIFQVLLSFRVWIWTGVSNMTWPLAPYWRITPYRYWSRLSFRSWDDVLELISPCFKHWLKF